MSFCFNTDLTLQDNIRQIATGELATALRHLSTLKTNPHEGVHETRKCLNRLRGLLRMLRPAVADTCYRRENNSFRNASRTLSAVRDSQAVIESFDKFVDIFRLQVNPAFHQSLRAKLIERRKRIESLQIDQGDYINNLISELDNAATAVGSWPITAVDSDNLARGLEQVYRGALNGFQDARQEQSSIVLHKWRKSARYLRYQFELLCGVDEAWAKPRYEGFRKLSDLLGSHIDLGLLSCVLENIQAAESNTAEYKFYKLLKEHQNTLYLESLEYGGPLLEENPETLRDRVIKALKIWLDK